MDKIEDAWALGTPHGGSINPGYLPPLLDVTDPCGFQGQKPPERRWLVDGWFPLRTVTMLSGDGGVGKSLLGLQLATAAATGISWLGMPVASIKSLVFACEDESQELHRRQSDINRAMGVDFADLERVHWADRVGLDNLLYAASVDEKGFRQPPDATDVYRSVMRHCLDNGIQLVVFDSLHDLFGGNENSRSEVRRFTQMLIRLAQEIDGAVVLLSHPSLSGRASGSGESGSTAWNNSVRSRLYLSRPTEDEADNNERILSRKKANYASIGDVVRLRWVDGAFVNADSGFGIVASLDRAGQRKRCEGVFLKLLARFGVDNRPVSENTHAGNYAPKMFGKCGDREGFTKKDFANAMEALFQASKIVVQTYGRSGDERRRIAPRQDAG